MSRGQPTVTALIPTRRRPELLRRAIESVLAQTWTELRVLVSDNASGDETEDVVRTIAARDGRVTYRRHPVDIGAYPNFQSVLDAVETELFSFLSDDDVLFPDLYRRAVSALEGDRGLGFYASQVVLYDVARGTHSLRPSKLWRAGRHDAGASARLMTDHHFVWTGCVFRREVRDVLGPLETVPMGDILFMGKAAASFPFFADLRPGALFSETETNYSRGYPVSELVRSLEVARGWASALRELPAADREAMVGVVDGRLKVMAHGMLRDALRRGDYPGFLVVADYLDARRDTSPRRRAKLEAARRGGWRFKALGLWANLQSGFKRRRASGWRRRSLEEILAEYSV